jgi:hypothetical protein
MQDAIESAITHLLSVLTRDRDAAGLSPGDLAEMRRMDPAGPAFPPALWRLLTANAVAGGVTALCGQRDQAERAFACLVLAMLEAGGSARGRSIGRALADTGYAEQRFVLLLRARGVREIAAEVRPAVRWCTTKGVRVRFDARGFGGFILDAALGRSGADSKAHAMARDYFTGPKPQDDAETSDAE